MTFKVLVVIAVVGLMLAIGLNSTLSTSSESSGGVYVIVTFSSLVYDVSPLLCKDDIVESLIPPGVDPHSYQLAMDDLRKLQKADIILSTGHTPLEVSIRKLVEEGRLNALLVEIPSIPGIKVLENPVTHTPNLHMPIYDPSNYKVFIKYVARVLGEVNPRCRKTYINNAERIIRRLDEITAKAPRLNVTAVADTPLCQYAISWLSVNISHLVVKEHDVPVSPDDLGLVESMLRDGEIGLVIATSPPEARASRILVELASKYRVPVLYVPSPLLPSSILDKLENITLQAVKLNEELSYTRHTSIEKSESSTSLLLTLSLTTIMVVLGLASYRIHIGITFTMLIIAGATLSTLYINPIWVIVMVSAALAYGSLSPVIAARRLYFLASASPHAALLAAVLGIPLTNTTRIGDEYVWAIVVGLALIYLAGYMIYRGLDTDTATAVFVAFTASSSVIALYYVLTHFPIRTNIWAIIVGDPLLATSLDALYAVVIACLTLTAIVLTCREQICIGVDRNYVKLAGVNVRFYDLLAYTLLALTTVALIRIVGFVLEHVLVLLPSAIAITWSRSARNAMLLSINVSLTACILGLYLSIIFNQAPAGITGLILLIIYLAVLVMRKKM